MPLWISIIYWGAAVLTIIRLFPQIYVTVTKRQISNLSISSQVYYIVGCLFWIIYSIVFFATLGWAMLLVNILALLVSLLLIFYVILIRYQNRKKLQVLEEQNKELINSIDLINPLEMKIKIALLLREQATNKTL